MGKITRRILVTFGVLMLATLAVLQRRPAAASNQAQRHVRRPGRQECPAAKRPDYRRELVDLPR